jgi:DNA (cytosine-5)-methyltransferase 1
MRHGSLFSGIGGFDLAAEWMGWENVFHCEWMEFPRKVLDYHFPNADSHIDICKTDFKKYEGTIDIISGGFPCQPFSLAGKRKGTDDERYLWGEMLRAIQEIKPRFVIAENVFGITNIDGGLVFQQVCLDLENEGYEVQPFIIPACAKNAPHRRDRCWFIATNTNCNDGRSTDRKGGCQESKANGEGQQSIHSRIGATSNEGHVANSESKQSEWVKLDGQQKTCKSEQKQFGRGNCQNVTTNSDIRKREQSAFDSRVGRFGQPDEKDRWILFPTQPPVCGGDDGLPTELDGITFPKWRAESIKGYGNAIVPQIAHQLFQIINDL